MDSTVCRDRERIFSPTEMNQYNDYIIMLVYIKNRCFIIIHNRFTLIAAVTEHLDSKICFADTEKIVRQTKRIYIARLPTVKCVFEQRSSSAATFTFRAVFLCESCDYNTANCYTCNNCLQFFTHL